MKKTFCFIVAFALVFTLTAGVYATTGNNNGCTYQLTVGSNGNVSFSMVADDSQNHDFKVKLYAGTEQNIVIDGQVYLGSGSSFDKTVFAGSDCDRAIAYFYMDGNLIAYISDYK